MTTEEAIRTLELAISEVEREYPMNYAAAINKAILALRAQAEAEKNEPLTLEELWKMDGEPVWIQPKEKNRGIWAFVDTCCGLVRIFGTRDRERTFGICRHFDTYGRTWLAYRRKPKEVYT